MLCKAYSVLSKLQVNIWFQVKFRKAREISEVNYNFELSSIYFVIWHIYFYSTSAYVLICIYIFYFSFYYSGCDVLKDFNNLINVDVDVEQ